MPIRREPLPRHIQQAIEQHKAKEMQREKQQGLGKPIIGTEFKGYQFVGVGNTVHYGKWKTFFDFLSNYIKDAHHLGFYGLGPPLGLAPIGNVAVRAGNPLIRTWT